VRSVDLRFSCAELRTSGVIAAILEVVGGMLVREYCGAGEQERVVYEGREVVDSGEIVG
jgi:hypothetical protein